MIKTHKLKGISKSHDKNINYDEYYSCSFGGDYQRECDIFIIRSINHEMYSQKVRKKTISASDEK